jgi:hypothetical protein
LVGIKYGYKGGENYLLANIGWLGSIYQNANEKVFA